MTETKTSSVYNSPITLGVMLLLAVAVFKADAIITAIKPAPSAPPAVIVPTTSLASTIPDERSREQVAAYCEGWVAMMDNVKDLGHFYSSRKIGDVALQQADQLPPGLAAFDEALAKRLEAAMGGNLAPNQTDLKVIKGVLLEAAKELRGD